MKKRSIVLSVLAGLTTVALALPLLAASVNPIHLPGAAAKSCAQLASIYAPGETWHEVKVVPSATSGTDGTLAVAVTYASKLQFDWSTVGEGPAVDAVYAKSGSQGSNLYLYPSQSHGDTKLSVPKRQALSHVLFCYSGIPANQAPVATGDEYSTPQDTALTVAVPGVLENDTDQDGDALTAAVVADPTNGTLVLSADGSFTYTPDGGFSGLDSFTYRANDGTADSGTATVTIEVLPSLNCDIDTDFSVEGQPTYIVRPENGGETCSKTFTYQASQGIGEGDQFVELIAEGDGRVVFLEYLEFLPEAPNPDSPSQLGRELYYDDNLDDGVDATIAKLCLQDPRVMDGGPLFDLHDDYDSADESDAVLPEGETTCIISAEFVTTGSVDGPLVKAAYHLYNVGDGFRTFR